MIPAPKGRNSLLVKHYKLSCEDQLEVGQQYSAFLSEQPEILIHRIRRTTRRRLLSAFGESEKPGKDMSAPRRRTPSVAFKN